MKRRYSICMLMPFIMAAMSCGMLDNRTESGGDDSDSIYVSLEEVAEILSCLPLQDEHMKEVHDAVVDESVFESSFISERMEKVVVDIVCLKVFKRLPVHLYRVLPARVAEVGKLCSLSLIHI